MLQETVSMTKGTLGFETTVTVQRTLLGSKMPLIITSRENKRWLLKPLFDKHIYLVLAARRGEY